MNCPKYQKKLPKSNPRVCPNCGKDLLLLPTLLPVLPPRVCPNCGKDLTAFYKMKEKQGEKIQVDKKTPPYVIVLIAVLALCLLAGAVVGVYFLTREETPEVVEPFDMATVKAEINSKQVSDFVESAEPTDYVKLTITNFGELVVRLRPDIAPLSAQNFKDLVSRHYYDGLSFHRVIPGFMIQGGAGRENLTPIKGEFSANGVENPLLHVRGVLSMARTTDMNSATSQFFLMHADYPSLNGSYAAFGYIVAGLETVDRVCEIELGYDSRGEQSVPQVDVILESAVFVTPKQ